MRYVILSDYEINGYDDSDFMYSYVDLDERSVGRHCYASTRGAGICELEDAVSISKVDDLVRSEIELILHEYARAELECWEGFMVGDIVRVVKGRKYTKGEEFEVVGRSEYNDKYGRVQTVYLNFEGGRIDSKNVKMVSRNISDDVLEAAIDTLRRRGTIHEKYSKLFLLPYVG